MSGHWRLSFLFSHIRVGLTIRRRIEDFCGQQRSYGVNKLFRLEQRLVGLGVTHMGSTAIISDAPQVG